MKPTEVRVPSALTGSPSLHFQLPLSMGFLRFSPIQNQCCSCSSDSLRGTRTIIWTLLPAGFSMFAPQIISCKYVNKVKEFWVPSALKENFYFYATCLVLPTKQFKLRRLVKMYKTNQTSNESKTIWIKTILSRNNRSRSTLNYSFTTPIKFF